MIDITMIIALVPSISALLLLAYSIGEVIAIYKFMTAVREQDKNIWEFIKISAIALVVITAIIVFINTPYFPMLLLLGTGEL